MRYIYVEREGGEYKLSGDLSWQDYYKVRQTGILGDTKICAIEVSDPWEGTEKQASKVLLYDFLVDTVFEADKYRYAGDSANALRSLR